MANELTEACRGQGSLRGGAAGNRCGEEEAVRGGDLQGGWEGGEDAVCCWGAVTGWGVAQEQVAKLGALGQRQLQLWKGRQSNQALRELSSRG